jgi:hypothetical protein
MSMKLVGDSCLMLVFGTLNLKARVYEGIQRRLLPCTINLMVKVAATQGRLDAEGTRSSRFLEALLTCSKLIGRLEEGLPSAQPGL